MSVHYVYIVDGVKHMRPIHSRKEYLALRNGKNQIDYVRRIRQGEERLKFDLVQMNYSCLPNDDGSLKGSTRLTSTVGMDIDHIPADQMQPVKERILAKKDELGLQMLEQSARGEGYHLVFKRHQELTNEANLEWASNLLEVKFDNGAKDITRVFFTTTGSENDLIFLSDEIFRIEEVKEPEEPKTKQKHRTDNQQNQDRTQDEKVEAASLAAFDLCAEEAGLNPSAMDVWGEHNWHTNLMAVLSVGVAKLMSRGQLRAVVAQRLPNYVQTADCQKLIDYFYEKYDADKGFMNASLREINAMAQKKEEDALNEDSLDDSSEPQLASLGGTLRMPQGVRDSIEAVGSALAMPVVTAICPCIGALATGVKLDVHGQKKGLNLIAYIAGDFASGKGSIDPVIEAWMSEISALDKMYNDQEEEWRKRIKAAKNKKEQPEEIKLPIRFITFNNTVANLAERLANTEGKHAFSFTPEADTVAQKWKSSMSDFSVMLRQSYDGSKFDREAKSVDAVNVHIAHLLWNVTMCGTPDALYRVVTNYTDGFQSRIALARTPDNTFAPLEDKPNVLTPRHEERIRQIAHLLPLMQGEVVLPKLEARGREWLEKIRLETIKNDDRVKGRQRMRVCVTAQRMTCCLMLCKVCERLIHQYGLSAAETRLKQEPNLWKELLLKTQTPQMLEVYDVIADSLIENALYFFRERIEKAFGSRYYSGSQNGDRRRRGKNDSIFERLDPKFTFDQAMQQTIIEKGASVTRNTIIQMLKNWRNQKMIEQLDVSVYRKLQ